MPVITDTDALDREYTYDILRMFRRLTPDGQAACMKKLRREYGTYEPTPRDSLNRRKAGR